MCVSQCACACVCRQMFYAKTLKCCTCANYYVCATRLLNLLFNPSEEQLVLLGLMFLTCTNRRWCEDCMKTMEKLTAIVIDNHKRLQTLYNAL